MMTTKEFVDSLPVKLRPKLSGIVFEVTYGQWSGSHFQSSNTGDGAISLSESYSAIATARERLLEKIDKAAIELMNIK